MRQLRSNELNQISGGVFMYQTSVGGAMVTCLLTGLLGSGVGSMIGNTAAKLVTAPFTFTGIMSNPEPFADIAAAAGRNVGGLAGFATALVGFASSNKIIVPI